MLTVLTRFNVKQVEMLRELTPVSEQTSRVYSIKYHLISCCLMSSDNKTPFSRDVSRKEEALHKTTGTAEGTVYWWFCRGRKLRDA